MAAGAGRQPLIRLVGVAVTVTMGLACQADRPPAEAPPVDAIAPRDSSPQSRPPSGGVDLLAATALVADSAGAMTPAEALEFLTVAEIRDVRYQIELLEASLVAYPDADSVPPLLYDLGRFYLTVDADAPEHAAFRAVRRAFSVDTSGWRYSGVHFDALVRLFPSHPLADSAAAQLRTRCGVPGAGCR